MNSTYFDTNDKRKKTENFIRRLDLEIQNKRDISKKLKDYTYLEDNKISVLQDDSDSNNQVKTLLSLIGSSELKKKKKPQLEQSVQTSNDTQTKATSTDFDEIKDLVNEMVESIVSSAYKNEVLGSQNQRTSSLSSAYNTPLDEEMPQRKESVMSELDLGGKEEEEKETVENRINEQLQARSQLVMLLNDKNVQRKIHPFENGKQDTFFNLTADGVLRDSSGQEFNADESSIDWKQTLDYYQKVFDTEDVSKPSGAYGWDDKLDEDLIEAEDVNTQEQAKSYIAELIRKERSYFNSPKRKLNTQRRRAYSKDGDELAKTLSVDKTGNVKPFKLTGSFARDDDIDYITTYKKMINKINKDKRKTSRASSIATESTIADIQGRGFRRVNKDIKARGFKARGLSKIRQAIEDKKASGLAYKSLGSKFLKMSDLHNNELMLKYNNRTPCMKRKKISDDLKELIKKMVFEDILDYELYSKLSIEEKELTQDILKMCSLYHRLQEPLKKPKDELLHEYHKLLGSIKHGNDSQEVISELKRLSVHLYDQKLIEKEDFFNIMINI